MMPLASVGTINGNRLELRYDGSETLERIADDVATRLSVFFRCEFRRVTERRPAEGGEHIVLSRQEGLFDFVVLATKHDNGADRHELLDMGLLSRSEWKVRATLAEVRQHLIGDLTQAG